MSQSTTANNSPLQLYPPKILGQTELVIGADVGASLVVYDLVPDGEGAKVGIDPPLVGLWESGDVVKLWLVNDTTLLSFTTIDDPNVTIFLRIPRNRLSSDQVNGLYYTVERNAGNVGTSKPPLTVLYNRIRPGFKDRFPNIDGHSELKLDLSDLIAKGVDKDFVSAQICVNYPYSRAYDTITLKCNGEIQTFPVSKDQAPQPPSPGTEEPTTIFFTITRDFLEKAKRLDNILNFSFTVTDQLLNGTDPDAVWSAVLAVLEDLDGKLLIKPILLERIEDYPEQGSGKIELDKLGNNNLSLVILTSDDRFVVGYTVNATYTAKINGQPDQVILVEGKVEADKFGVKQVCIIEVLNEYVIDASSVTVTYELLDLSGALVAKSGATTEPVVGTYLELKPPSILQANDTILDPMKALSQLTIVVPQGALLGSDLLSVCWIAKPGTHPEGSITTPPRPISEIGLSIDIPPSVLAFCLGDSVGVLVSYIITRDGIPLPSETLPLTVLDLPQTELSAPRLNQAADAGEGSELRLSDLTPDGKMWCPGFPLIAVGQFVWLCFKGTNADGSVFEQCVWSAPFAFVNDDWVNNGYFEATAPYEDLIGLEDETPLTMDMRVAFGKSEDLALAKRFLLRTYTVSAVQVVVPAITSVKGTSSNEEIPHGSLTVQTDITLTGTATPSTKIDLVNGSETISDDEIPVDARGNWTAKLSALVAGKTYNLRAKRKDGELSAARDLVVVALVNPTLDNVLDDKGVEIPDRGITVSIKLKLKGTASYGQKVEIFDGNGAGAVSKGIAPVDAKGEWEFDIEVDVQEVAHPLFARSLYHDSLVDSNVRHVTVISGLIVDTTPIILNGQNYSIDHEALGWLRTGIEPAGTFETRTVSGGVPPYSFTTNAPIIASVDNKGCIRSEGNGEAVITISDTLGQTKTIRVTCTNTTRLLINLSEMMPLQALEWIDANGARILEQGTPIATILNNKYRATKSRQVYLSGRHPTGYPYAIFHASYDGPGQYAIVHTHQADVVSKPNPIICFRK